MTRIGRRNLTWIEMENRVRQDTKLKPLRSFGLLVGGVFGAHGGLARFVPWTTA